MATRKVIFCPSCKSEDIISKINDGITTYYCKECQLELSTFPYKYKK